MAPQGIGAALVMPLAGRPHRSSTVPGGSSRAGWWSRSAGTFAYTQLGAHTSFVLLAVSLFVRGIGFGFVMMPAISAAYQTLSHEQVPRASTAVNIVQRVGGSIGTALVAVVARAPDRGPGHGSRPAVSSAISTGSVVHGSGSHNRSPSAFGATFWWTLAMTVVALVPALSAPRPAAARRFPRPSAASGERRDLTASGGRRV